MKKGFLGTLFAAGLCCSTVFAAGSGKQDPSTIGKEIAPQPTTQTDSAAAKSSNRDLSGQTGSANPMEAAKARLEAERLAHKLAIDANSSGEEGGVAGGGDGADDCASANVISGASGTTPASNVSATYNAADLPAGHCFASRVDVWFSWTAPNTGNVTFSFCPAQGGSAGWDTVLAAYAGCAGTQIICNDDSCGLQSSILFAATAGTEYRIRVSSFGTTTGSGTLGWFQAGGGGGAPNDECTGAIAIGDGTISVDNSTATQSADPVGCGAAGNDLWYCYTASCDGLVTATTCLGGAAGLDTVLQVYDGCCPNLGASIGCNDDGPPSCPAPGGFSGSTVQFIATAGNTYSIRVWGYGGDIGTFDLTLSCAAIEPCPECPPGAFIENEPVCADEYVDATNGGCNSIPNVFQNVSCGDTICGETGTYLFTGLQYRDTDWYEICTAGGDISVTATGAFPVRLFILDANCPTAIIATAAGTVPCQPVTVEAFGLAPGAYRFFVGPDVFAGVPCGTPYVATVTCSAGPAGGRCCLYEPEVDCVNVADRAACDALGGVFRSCLDCSTACPPPPSENDECADAIDITDGTYPFDNSQATQSPEPVGCGAPGADLWWCYTASCDGLVTATTCLGGVAGLDTVLQVYDGCCDTGLGASIGCNDDGPPGCPAPGGFSGSTVQWIATAGNRYTIRVWGYGGVLGAGDLTVSCEAIEPCPECPPGSFIEGEPVCGDGYVDATNGGCNSVPNVFQSVSCGDTICGETGTYLFTGLQYRDTDWYEICVDDGDITVTATGAFPVRLFILNNLCPPTVIATAAGTVPCQPVTVTASVLAGTYRVFVGPDVFAGVPCGTPYVATIECSACTPRGACCTVDGCTITTEAECNGEYLGDDTDCGTFAYEVTRGNAAIEDISGTGTAGCVGDDCSTLVPLGFTFNYFGGPQSDINVGSNGHLRFGAGATAFGNPGSLPTADGYNNVIAPYWDDWMTSCAGATLFTETRGTAPNRRFIAQWNVGNFSSCTTFAVFQAILYEGSDCIEFRYGDPLGLISPVVGIENADGTAGVNVSPLPVSGESVLICPQPLNDPCNPVGACCLGVECVITTEAECDAQQGDYAGDGEPCETLVGGNEYSSGTVNIAIPDGTGNGTPGAPAVSTVIVGDPNTIETDEIQIGVVIAHTFQGDLIATVTSPAGTVVELFNRPGVPVPGGFGSGNDNYGNPATLTRMVFAADAAQGPYELAPFVDNPVGKWLPTGNLNAFVGENKGGTWTLTVTDNAGADIGTIIEWAVIKKGEPQNTCPLNECGGVIRGDSNGDGIVNNFDIDPFVAALVNAGCTADPVCRCRNDINCDGIVNNFDIDPFVACLTVGCPPCP